MIDLHSDTIYALWKRRDASTLLTNDLSIDLGKLKRGKVRGQCFALFTPMHASRSDSEKDKSAWQIVNELYDRFLVEIERCGIKQMKKASELEEDCLHAILTTEEGAILEGDISRLETLAEWGVKSFSLTWNYENELAYPNSKDAEVMDKGLKEKGIEAVKECNRLGILVDVSHLNDGGFYDVAKYSEKPFVATHSNARSVTNVTRNLTDDMLKTLADKGGVAGLNLCPLFLSNKQKTMKPSESRVEDMVNHVMHIWKTAGSEVLALGSDFDGISGKLEIPSPDCFYLLREALAKKGMSQSVLDKMWMGNALRVFKEAEV